MSKLEKHLELITEITTTTSIREGKSNPEEIAKYYHEMRMMNSKASPWIIFLSMADEIGYKMPKSLDKYPNLNRKETLELEKALRRYQTQLDKLLNQFPPKEKREIKNSQAPTGAFLPQQSGTEVAKNLGIARQAVSSSTKKGLPKAYQAVRDMYPKMKPFEAFMEMAKGFGMREQAGKLLRLMPKKEKDEIQKDAEKFRK